MANKEFKQKINNKYEYIEDLDYTNSAEYGIATCNYFGSYFGATSGDKIAFDYLELAKALEDWRTIEFPGFQVWNNAEKKYMPLKALRRGGIPTVDECLISCGKPTTLRIRPWYEDSDKAIPLGLHITEVVNGAETDYYEGTQNKSKQYIREKWTSNHLIPPLVIFVLQAGGGGGGGAGTKDSKKYSGSGGGGGGFITGVLELDFSVFEYYEIEIGAGGQGGGGVAYHGENGSQSVIYGYRKTNKQRAPIVRATGGNGGKYAVEADWHTDGSDTAGIGGISSVEISTFVGLYSRVQGGYGGTTYNTLSVLSNDKKRYSAGELISPYEMYYAEIDDIKTAENVLLTWAGGAGGTAGLAVTTNGNVLYSGGGGGASQLGTGGAGGSTLDGSQAGQGYGSGGGGAGWKQNNASVLGSNGACGFFELYY